MWVQHSKYWIVVDSKYISLYRIYLFHTNSTFLSNFISFFSRAKQKENIIKRCTHNKKKMYEVNQKWMLWRRIYARTTHTYRSRNVIILFGPFVLLLHQHLLCLHHFFPYFAKRKFRIFAYRKIAIIRLRHIYNSVSLFPSGKKYQI